MSNIDGSEERLLSSKYDTPLVLLGKNVAEIFRQTTCSVSCTTQE